LLGADLRGANLSNAHLVGADLSRSVLSHADLSDAMLTDTDLREAQLSGANLRNANMINSDLRLADLTSSNLSGAILYDANLTNANLHHADFSLASLGETFFISVDLTTTGNLETCKHRGPSNIDHHTLRMSKSLPLPFLRGVGLPNSFIEYLPSLVGQAIRFYSCFISYSARDQEFAERIHADLQDKDVRCWFAPHDMPIGGKILDEIDFAIRYRDKLLLILSEHSIKSGWVEDEVSKAFAEERKREQTVLFPIRIDNAVMDTNEAWAAKLRDQRNIGDFRRWRDHQSYKRSFERVLRDLKWKG
jgi:uncharacterized protein YjbI with pentapeptide repeats